MQGTRTKQPTELVHRVLDGSQDFRSAPERSRDRRGTRLVEFLPLGPPAPHWIWRMREMDPSGLTALKKDGSRIHHGHRSPMGSALLDQEIPFRDFSSSLRRRCGSGWSGGRTRPLEADVARLPHTSLLAAAGSDVRVPMSLRLPLLVRWIVAFGSFGSADLVSPALLGPPIATTVDLGPAPPFLVVSAVSLVSLAVSLERPIGFRLDGALVKEWKEFLISHANPAVGSLAGYLRGLEFPQGVRHAVLVHAESGRQRDSFDRLTLIEPSQNHPPAVPEPPSTKCIMLEHRLVERIRSPISRVCQEQTQ